MSDQILPNFSLSQKWETLLVNCVQYGTDNENNRIAGISSHSISTLQSRFNTM